jgi:hypothetical protein
MRASKWAISKYQNQPCVAEKKGAIAVEDRATALTGTAIVKKEVAPSLSTSARI